MKLLLLVFAAAFGLAVHCPAAGGPQGVQVKLVATQSIVPGEPILVGFQVLDKQVGSSKEPAIDLKADGHAGVTAHISSESPSPLVSGVVGNNDGIDQISQIRIQPFSPEFRSIFLLNFDTSRLTPGAYELTVSMNTTTGFAERGLPERFEPGSERELRTTETFTLTVGEPSDQRLLEAAYRIERYMTDKPRLVMSHGEARVDLNQGASGAVLSEGIPYNFGSMETNIQALESMPPVPCAQAWRSLLLTEWFPRKGYAAMVLAKKKSPETRRLLIDMLAFVKTHHDHADAPLASVKGLAERDLFDMREIQNALRIQSGKAPIGKAID